MYECDVDWLRPIIEGGWEVKGSSDIIQWVKKEKVGVKLDGINEVGVGIDEVYCMNVNTGGSFKGWLEVRRSGIQEGYGLFAMRRFEKGSIITAKIPKEMGTVPEGPPTRETLFLGWSWAVKKNTEDVGRHFNAVHLDANGMLRTARRIMPGTEIVVDAGSQSTFVADMEWLDTVVFMERKHALMNWHRRTYFGKVISGDRKQGYTVQYNNGKIRKMNKAEVQRLAVFREVDEEENSNENVVKKRKGDESYGGMARSNDNVYKGPQEGI